MRFGADEDAVVGVKSKPASYVQRQMVVTGVICATDKRTVDIGLIESDAFSAQSCHSLGAQPAGKPLGPYPIKVVENRPIRLVAQIDVLTASPRRLTLNAEMTFQNEVGADGWKGSAGDFLRGVISRGIGYGRRRQGGDAESAIKLLLGINCVECQK